MLRDEAGWLDKPLDEHVPILQELQQMHCIEGVSEVEVHRGDEEGAGSEAEETAADSKIASAKHAVSQQALTRVPANSKTNSSLYSCGCKQNCLSEFVEEDLRRFTETCKGATREQRMNLFVAWTRAGLRHPSDHLPPPSKKHRGLKKKAPMYMFFRREICARAAAKLHGISLATLQRFLCQITDPYFGGWQTMKYHGRNEDAAMHEVVCKYLDGYVSVFGLPSPAGKRRAAKYGNEEILVLASETTKKQVWECFVSNYRRAHAVNGNKTAVSYDRFCKIWAQERPWIVIAHRGSDFCDYCMQVWFQKKRRTFGRDDRDYFMFDQHIMLAKQERRFYNRVQAHTKKLLQEWGAAHPEDDMHRLPLGEFRSTARHFVFDFSQNINLPYFAREPSQIFFKTTVAVTLFGVVDLTAGQMNAYFLAEHEVPPKRRKGELTTDETEVGHVTTTVPELGHGLEAPSSASAAAESISTSASSVSTPSSSACKTKKRKHRDALYAEAVRLGHRSISSKNSDTVVAMLHHAIESRSESEADLYLTADNCSGQNKNRTVVQYCLWRVMTGRNRSVTLSFLIPGHTKNHCDGGFGRIKKALYRQESLITPDHVVSVAERLTNIHPKRGEEVEWLRWTDYLGQFFKPAVGISSFYVFHMSINFPGHVVAATSSSAIVNLRNSYQVKLWDLRKPGLQVSHFAGSGRELNGKPILPRSQFFLGLLPLSNARYKYILDQLYNYIMDLYNDVNMAEELKASLGPRPGSGRQLNKAQLSLRAVLLQDERPGSAEYSRLCSFPKLHRMYTLPLKHLQKMANFVGIVDEEEDGDRCE